MKKQTTENYLDQLLNSVDTEPIKKRSRKPERNLDPLEVFERELMGESSSPEKMTARDEEDFLREFEAELLTDDLPNLDEDRLGNSNQRPKHSGMEETDAAISGMLDHMDSFSDQLVPTREDPPQVDENADFDGLIPGEPMFPAEEEGTPAIASEPFDAAPAADEPLSAGELDLSGMGGGDLMDLLSDQEGMEDLGEMLSADSSNEPYGGVDSIGDYADAELQAQMQSSDPNAEEEGKKKKKRGKKKKENAEGDGNGKSGGFFSKISTMLFGEDDSSGEVSISAMSAGADVDQLADENLQILKELEGEEAGNADKKKKAKKEKKPKAAKPAKEAKPKKPPKPKKEKKPKEKDNTPPLPKGPVRAIVLMGASLFGLIVLGSNLLDYQASVNEAKELYLSGSYADAYEALAGLEIKEKDQKFYRQLSVLAPTSAEYNTYLIFSNSNRKVEALDALVCAYGRYEMNREKAKEYECLGEYEVLGSKVIRSLLEDYDMTGNEALAIYSARTRKEYTLRLNEKCRSLGWE